MSGELHLPLCFFYSPVESDCTADKDPEDWRSTSFLFRVVTVLEAHFLVRIPLRRSPSAGFSERNTLRSGAASAPLVTVPSRARVPSAFYSPPLSSTERQIRMDAVSSLLFSLLLAAHKASTSWSIRIASRFKLSPPSADDGSDRNGDILL